MSKTRLTVDRFEGEGKKIAVLLTEDDQTIDFPRAILPKGTKAGDVLSLSFEKDEEATRAVLAETEQLQKKLAKNDDGGDLTI